MTEYNVKVTTQANNDILDYALYIQNELLSPQAAKKYVLDMKKAIKTLDRMPSRNPLVDEEPWRTHGIRKMIARGYIIYYWICEEKAEVTVIGVVYGRRNQIDQLANMDME